MRRKEFIAQFLRDSPNASAAEMAEALAAWEAMRCEKALAARAAMYAKRKKVTDICKEQKISKTTYYNRLKKSTER
jgi:DNA-binding phage protein